MAVVPTIKKTEELIQKFIDWDKFENVFYNNFYLDKYKIVIKMPLVPRKDLKDEIKIRKFNLEKYTFLISYD
ncbi:MAG: hypothetical protein ACFE9I_02910 [Candidatus Hermodarchaeota archaeon]